MYIIYDFLMYKYKMQDQSNAESVKRFLSYSKCYQLDKKKKKKKIAFAPRVRTVASICPFLT